MNPIELFLSSFERGGPVMWPILAVSVVVWVIGFDKLFYLRRLTRARGRFLDSVRESVGSVPATGDSDYDGLLAGMSGGKGIPPSFSYAFREFLLNVVPRLDKGFPTMSAWIAAAPLLGLLGTVAGMIHTFKIIMEFGVGNPHLMAEGISIALLTTQAGLTVAFPGMLFHNYLLNRKNVVLNSILRDGEELGRRFE